MVIQVKLFATLGMYAPHGVSTKPFALEVEPGTTGQDLISRLKIPDEEREQVSRFTKFRMLE